jgi:hypothetical protein
MYPPHPITESIIYLPHIPMIDQGFDRFELNRDLETNLREVAIATFYHDALDPEE